MKQELIARLEQGRLHDPFQLLGAHPTDKGWDIRVWMPTAKQVRLEDRLPMRRLTDSGLFSLQLTAKEFKELPAHYAVHWEDYNGESYSQVSPYSFQPLLGELDLHLFAEGQHWQIYEHLGAHQVTVNGISGVRFAVWAPSAERVSVVGDFNGWHGFRHPMRSLGGSGVWELFMPGLQQGDNYKFEIRNANSGDVFSKTDPYARAMELRPQTASYVFNSHYQWRDTSWLQQRKDFAWNKKPVSIYEVHLGSWQRNDAGGFLNYREIAHRLVEYVKWMGYTHIELMPISEHPLDESWGYQTSGYFAPTSRFGSPDDFRYFVDHCHQHGIGVFLDWVPAHFPKDFFALARFDGTPLYEHADPRLGEHRDWGTYIFNFGRNEVRNFLIANALYWLKEFHIDGLRVDAVASMLYLDYSRDDGDWVPNAYGGRENLDAIKFLQQLNHEVHSQHPGALVMAEESTSWPMVSRPTWMGGLGFSMKWNMGWMNDTLDYFSKDPLYRPFHHNQLTFSQMYAYSENFILPFSHDEVVHMKGSLAGKMPGDDWQKMANLRLLLSYQWLHPGKKLLFMGCDFGQWTEWNASASLPWHLCDHANHRGIMELVRQLNRLYCSESALHERDFEHQGFSWIDCHDYSQSVISFARYSADDALVCVFNFTPVPRYHYRLGLPGEGEYQEIFNSDSVWYGGSNLGNSGALTVERQSWQNQPVSACLTLPPLGCVVFKRKQNKAQASTPLTES